MDPRLMIPIGSGWNPSVPLGGKTVDFWMEPRAAQVFGGGARDFSGGTDFFALASQPDPLQLDFALELWFRADAWVDGSGFFCTGGRSAGEDGFAVHQKSTGGDIRWSLCDSVQAGSYATSDANTNCASEQWYHLAINYDRSGNAEMFLGGVSVDTLDISTYSGNLGATIGEIGRRVAGKEFNGRLARIRYYEGYLLTPTDIAWSYNSGNGRRAADLTGDMLTYCVHGWDAMEASGNLLDSIGSPANDGTDTNTVGSADGPAAMNAADSSGNANHGVLTGFSGQLPWDSDVSSAIGSGHSLTFDGTDDEVICGNIGNVTAVSFYIKSLVDNQEIMALQDSTATAVTVAAGVLTFGGSLTASAITVDGVSKSAAQAGVLINDNGWHLVAFSLTSVAASDLRLGTDSSAYGNIRLDQVQFNAGVLAEYPFNDGPQSLTPVTGDPVNVETLDTNRHQLVNAVVTQRPEITLVDSDFNGHESLTFDGTDDYLRKAVANLFTGSAGAVFVVSKYAGSAAEYRAMWGIGDEGANNDYMFVRIHGNLDHNLQRVIGGATNPALSSDVAVSTTAAELTALTSDGFTISLRRNAVNLPLTADTGTNTGQWFSGFSNLDNFTIGALRTNAVSNYWLGKIAAILVFDAELTAGEIQRVERYLNNRFKVY